MPAHRVEFAAMHATVIVELKPSVLDPQGKAIQHSISTLGFEGVERYPDALPGQWWAPFRAILGK